jgi:signal transduction histidine kinase
MPFSSPARMLRLQPTDHSSVVLTFKVAAVAPRRARACGVGRPKTNAVDLQRWREEAFISTCAQELRQPLLVLSAAVEVIRHAPGSEAAVRAMTAIERQIGQVNRIAKDLTNALQKVPQRDVAERR